MRSVQSDPTRPSDPGDDPRRATGGVTGAAAAAASLVASRPAQSRPRRRCALAGAALVGVLALGGCAVPGLGGSAGSRDGGASGTASEEPDAATGDGVGSDGATPDGEAEPGSAAAAGVDPTSVKPVATMQIDQPNAKQPGQKMTWRLLGLHRRGKVVELTASVTTAKDVGEAGDGAPNLFAVQGGDWSPWLVDQANAKVHRVPHFEVKSPVGGIGTFHSPQSEASSVHVAPGGTAYLWAVFAAPPDDVTTMDVFLGEGLPAVRGVKLQ